MRWLLDKSVGNSAVDRPWAKLRGLRTYDRAQRGEIKRLQRWAERAESQQAVKPRRMQPRVEREAQGLWEKTQG